MNLETIGENIQASYRGAVVRYRTDDEIEVMTEHHRHLKSILAMLTSSFGRPITVLDAGCGTGRYFYCLKNVERLLGLDVSAEMLDAARTPVRAREVTAQKIELQTGNIHLVNFPAQSFDVIYSLGMFGHGCPMTVDLGRKFRDWLAPGGQLFFDLVDVATLPLSRRFRRALRQRAYPLLPQPIKALLDTRNQVPFCALSKRELESIMRESGFHDFSVTSQVCNSPLWHGRHLECVASKPAEAPRTSKPARRNEPVAQAA